MSAVSELVPNASRRFSEGTVLFREGEQGTEMFVLRSGKVALTRSAAGRSMVLSTLGPGEFFGEMAILTGKPRTASATVVEDAQMLVIDPRTFEAMIRGSTEIAVRLMRSLAGRLASADERIEELGALAARSRLVRFLARAAEERGRPSPGGRRIDLPIADLPDAAGVPAPALRDAMRRVVQAGLARFDADGAVVADPARLAGLARFLAAGEGEEAL